MAFAEALQLLEPYGKDNEIPVFLIRNAEISDWRFLRDDDKMAKFTLRTEGCKKIDAVMFRDAAKAYESAANGNVDVFCNIEINTWRDDTKVQAIVRDVIPAENH